ncbi:MAG: small conductance mechanosensitive channel, partial [Solirubrobacteraceae bacterium]|nr:small conductance mechanosensitive channel [Solirubrobacteraceae bacterium]
MTPLAESFFQSHENELIALLSLALAAGLILIFDRTIKRRGKKMRSVLAPEGLDPVLDTRLRFVRRLVEATIAVIGVAVAISQFAAL